MKKEISVIEAYRYLLEKPGVNWIWTTNGPFTMTTDGAVINRDSKYKALDQLSEYVPVFVEVPEKPEETNEQIAKSIDRDGEDIVQEWVLFLNAVDRKLEPLKKRIEELERK